MTLFIWVSAQFKARATLFIAPPPKFNVEDVYTKYSVSLVFVLTATLKEGGGDEGGRGENNK